jgi:hypothetical protein
VDPSFAIFWRFIADQLASGVGVVAETNFQRGVSEPSVRELIGRARIVLAHCATRRDVALRRFEERFERGERHWCFQDRERFERLQAGLPDSAWERATPLDLDVPVLVVDTTEATVPTCRVSSRSSGRSGGAGLKSKLQLMWR